jgi:hypothetical protein
VTYKNLALGMPAVSGASLYWADVIGDGEAGVK